MNVGDRLKYQVLVRSLAILSLNLFHELIFKLKRVLKELVHLLKADTVDRSFLGFNKDIYRPQYIYVHIYAFNSYSAI